MKVILTSGSERIMSSVGLSVEDVVATCEDPTIKFAELADHGMNAETREPTVGPGLVYSAVRWFQDGRIVYIAANAIPHKGTLDPKQVEVAVVTLLNEGLPAGTINRKRTVRQIEQVIAESFGLPVRCHPSATPTFMYSGKWDGRYPPLEDKRFGGPFTVAGEFNYEKRLCKNVWAFSLDKYLAWFPRPARQVLRLATVKASLGARRAPSRRQSDRATHAAGVLEFHCKELMHLLTESGDQEEELHQWLFAEQHHVFLDQTAVNIWSKTRFGSKVSDFVIRKSNGTYTLVEIERANARIFQKGNGEPTAQFHHACQQVRDWQRYIGDNVHTVRSEQGLTDIAEPAGMVIMGRNADIDSDEARVRWLDMQNRHEYTILTYDGLCDSVRALAAILRKAL